MAIERSSSPWPALVLLLVAAEILFLVNLQHPLQMYFDETHYVRPRAI